MVEPTSILQTKALSLRMVGVQYVFFVANFIFVVLATFLMAVTAVTKWIPKEFSIFLDLDGEQISILKVIGIAIFTLSLLATLASIKQSFILFSTYGGFLLALLIVEINWAIRGFLIYNTCESVVASYMFKTIGSYYDTTKTNWDYMQHYMRCCGVHNSSDWAPYYVDGLETAVDGNVYNIPYSCCHNAHSTGCLSIVCGFVSKTLLIILYTIVSITVIKMWLLIFSCVLTITSKEVEVEEKPQQIRNTLSDDPNNHDLNGPSSSRG